MTTAFELFTALSQYNPLEAFGGIVDMKVSEDDFENQIVEITFKNGETESFYSIEEQYLFRGYTMPMDSGISGLLAMRYVDSSIEQYGVIGYFQQDAQWFSHTFCLDYYDSPYDLIESWLGIGAGTSLATESYQTFILF